MKLGLARISVVLTLAGIAMTAVGCGGDDFDVQDPSAPNVPPGETANPNPADPDQSPAPSNPNNPPAAKGPHVVSSLPLDKAKGVKDDATIVLKFDRAMDMPSVENAYVSLELPKEKVSFKWSPAHDELTIVPAQKLAYASGGANIGANGYAIKIEKSAKSETGVAMDADFGIAFSTLRRVTEKPPRVANLSGRMLENGGLKSTGALVVGDLWIGGIEHQQKSFLTYDLSALPDCEVEKATFWLPESGISGTPDDTTLGAFTGHQVFYSELDVSAFTTEPVSGLTFTRLLGLNGAPPARRADATAMVADDLANRVVRQNRTQLRLLYPKATNADSSTDAVGLEIADATLTVVCLAP